MTRKTEDADRARRDFLKLSVTAAPVVAVATVTGMATRAEAAEPDLDSDRLQDTEHTRAYYQNARF